MAHILQLGFLLAKRKVDIQMLVDNDSATDRELLHALRISGCPEPEVSDLVARVCRPGDYVIDGGANIGFFTVLMSKFVGPAGQVFSFEPGENNLFKLQENIKLNALTNVDTVFHPLWDKHEPVQLHMCVDGSKNSLAPHADTRGSQTIFAVTLNDYFPDDADEKLRLIKLDIEGAEEKALRGATRLFKNQPYIVAELNMEALPKFGSSPEKVCAFLREFGYSPFMLHADGALPTLIPRNTKVSPTRLNWNVLFATIEMVAAAWPEITT
jgi:FkbM family methyltransferase